MTSRLWTGTRNLVAVTTQVLTEAFSLLPQPARQRRRTSPDLFRARVKRQHIAKACPGNEMRAL